MRPKKDANYKFCAHILVAGAPSTTCIPDISVAVLVFADFVYIKSWSCSALYAFYVFHILHLSRFQRKSTTLATHCSLKPFWISSFVNFVDQHWHACFNHHIDVKQPKHVWQWIFLLFSYFICSFGCSWARYFRQDFNCHLVNRNRRINKFKIKQNCVIVKLTDSSDGSTFCNWFFYIHWGYKKK